MKIYKAQLDYQTYQPVHMPNGAAPLCVQEDGPGKIGLFYIGPDELLGEYMVEFGVFVIPTAVTIPEDVRLFPVNHPLINQVDPPNAKYIGTVNHHHVILGNPRQETLVKGK